MRFALVTGVQTCALPISAGMDAPAAEAVADTLVEGDLLGHDTHGLALLAPYIKEIETKSMEVSGTAKTLSDRGAALLWDGRRLPGPWLIRQSIDTLTPRAREFRSEEHTSELQSLMRNSYAVFCLKKHKN